VVAKFGPDPRPHRIPDDLLRAEAIDHDQQAARGDVDIGHGELTGVASCPDDAADEVQPVVCQRRGLARQGEIPPAEAPSIEPQRARLVADVVEQVVHQLADLGGRRRHRAHPGARSVQIGVGGGPEGSGDQLLR
jgi:hypothetical protein